MDLVPIFKVRLATPESKSLRQVITDYLMTENPVGWQKHLIKYAKSDYVNKDWEQANSESNVIWTGMKRIGVTDIFLARPGFKLDVLKMFENPMVKDAYTMIKILRHVSQCGDEISSFQVKKVIFEMNLRNEFHHCDNWVQVLNKILKHPNLSGKMRNDICQEWKGLKNVKLDLENFPFVKNGLHHLHAISEDALRIEETIQKRDVNETIKILSENKVRTVDFYVSNGQSLLIKSVHRCVDFACQLLNQAESIDFQANEVYSQGNTILHIALENSHGENEDSICKFILALTGKKFDFRHQNENGETVLHVACKKGFLQVVEELVKSDPKLLYIKDNIGKTPFYTACEYGNAGVVQRLANIKNKKIM